MFFSHNTNSSAKPNRTEPNQPVMKLVLSPTTSTTTSFHHHHQQHLFSPFFSSSLPFSSKRRRRHICLRRPRWSVFMAVCMSPTIAPAAGSSGVQKHNHHNRHNRMKDKIVVIMGATGTGKSRLSIDLATRFSPSEIVNSDKMQVYRGLDITTNKISFQDRRAVPHHFLGEFDTDEYGELSPSEFRKLAELSISGIVSRKRTPFLVGGSNSFVYSLLVEEYDPDSDVFNSFVSSSNSMSSELRYDCCFLWVDSSLPVLYEYLDKRVDDMLDSGMFDELAEFFDSDELERDSASRAGLRKAIGVPEFQRFFKKYPPGKHKGEDPVRRGAYEEAVREIKENTRQLAKRQIGKIMGLRRAGWDLHRVDATATFRRLLLMDDSDWRGVWERQVLEPSAKIVKRFLEE